MKVFKEEQKFTQLWMHILLIVSFSIPLIFVIRDWMRSDYEDDESKIALYVLLGSIVLVYALIFSLKLKSRIDENGIHFRFIPFHFKNRMINWEDIDKGYIRNYDAITEFGGWGIKGVALWRKSKGVAYNVKGDIGLQLELKNGKKILIGTQKQKEMKRVLETYNSKFVNSTK